MPLLPVVQGHDGQREGGLLDVLAMPDLRTDVERRPASFLESLWAAGPLEVRPMLEPSQSQKTPPGRLQAGVVCPKCGRSTARIIGQSESFAVVYLRCEDCHRTSVAPA